EVPRAALTAGDIARSAEFFSFGTNDLTQMGWGFSRDDVEGAFFSRYMGLGWITCPARRSGFLSRGSRPGAPRSSRRPAGAATAGDNAGKRRRVLTSRKRQPGRGHACRQ